MAQESTRPNLIRRWLDKFTSQKPQEESTSWGSKTWLTLPYSDSYNRNNSLLSLLGTISILKDGQDDNQRLVEVFQERGIESSNILYNISDNFDLIKHIRDQRSGIFSGNESYIAKYNYDDIYNESYLEKLDEEATSRDDLQTRVRKTQLQKQREGSLFSSDQILSSDFNKDKQYDENKLKLEELDRDNYVKSQREGTLKGNKNTLNSDFNKDEQYDDSKSILNIISDKTSNIEKIKSAGYKELNDIFRISDNIGHINNQQLGKLQSRNSNVENFIASYNKDNQYEKGNSYLSDLNNITQSGAGIPDRNATYASEQRDGILRDNNSTIISLFNNKKEYNINNADYNNLPIILSGQVTGIPLDEIFSVADKASYIIEQQNGILKTNNQNISSVYNNDNNYNKGDSTLNNDNDVVSDNNTPQMYFNRRQGYIRSQREGIFDNKISLFSSVNKYNEFDAFYTNSASGDRISNQEIKTNIDKIITANQEGYGVSVRTSVTDRTSFFQNFNKDYEYSLQTTQRAVTNVDARSFLTEEMDVFQSTESKRITSLVDKWYRKRLQILGGAKWSSGNGVDHLVNNRTISPDGTKSANNVFSGTTFGPEDYELMFFETVSSWTSKPSDNDVEKMAQKGFNVGQIKGSTSFKTREAFRGGSELISSGFEGLLESLGNFGGRYKDYNTLIEVAKQRLVEMYVPGLNRTTQPYTIAAPLETYLNQNLLLPTESPDVFKRVQDVFTELYVQNRSRTSARQFAKEAQQRNPGAIQDPTVFDNGVIAGTPLVEIERQGTLKSDPRKTPKVFTFIDDKRFLSYESKIQGFVNNIAGAVRASEYRDTNASSPWAVDTSDVGSELPAVITHNLQSYEQKLLNRQQKGDEQYFPFLFETDNRSRGNSGESYEQMCYFQATIDSINETFNPAWQQRHFFGRTEQVSTYTYTERALELSFSIIANTARQLQNLHERVSWLAQQTYGQYQFSGSQVNKLKSGPLIRVTIGDMFVGLGGYIQSLSYDWNFLGSGGKWEMTRGKRIPMACKVNMSFKVLHDDLPDRNYALYAGPLQRDDGLIHPEDGPLIKTNNRRTYTAGQQSQNEQYIDYLARNTSVG